MAIRNFHLRYAAFAVLFLAGPGSLLWAQASGYFIESRVVQRLAWIGDDHVRRYEVVVEKDQEGEYREHWREFTSDSFIVISLPPGKYRYRIIPYDYLDRPGERSEWMNVEVRSFPAPEVDDVSPALLHLKEGAVHILTVSGRNLSSDAEIYIRRLGEMPIFPVETNISADGNSARLLFDNGLLFPGDYEIVVKNPGGLETRAAAITFEYPKPEPIILQLPFVVNLAVAWMPMFPIFGDVYQEGPKLFGAILPGLAARFGFFSSSGKLFDAGLEIDVCWYIFDSPGEDEKVAQNAISTEIDLVMKMKLPNQVTAFCFRFGIGLSFMSGVENPAVPSPLQETANISTGVSFMWPVSKNFFSEIGLDYALLLTGTISGAFKPWLGFGLQF